MVGRMRSQARASLDAMLEEYRELTGRIGRLRDDLSSLNVTERSADGCASVTVNAGGELIRLAFDPTLARRLDPSSLAVRVEEASGAAAAEVRRRKQAMISELLPPGLRQHVGEDFVGGLPAVLGEAGVTGLLGRDSSRTAGEQR